MEKKHPLPKELEILVRRAEADIARQRQELGFRKPLKIGNAMELRFKLKE